MQYLKQSTAATVLIGPVLDADGAAVTGAVIGDFRLAKNGTVSTMAGNTISHSHNGCYLITLTTTDTNTLDRLSVSVGNTSYAMTVFRYTVLSATQFDALVTNGTITPDAIADQVWDEILTGATHNIATSAGRRLRQLASVIVHSGTAQGAGTGNNQIQLDTGASSTNGAYDPGLVYIETGTGAGQTRLILQYNGSTRTATVDRDWRVNPDNTSEFVILGDAGRQHVNEGLAQAGTSTTITLNTNASSSDDAYNGQLIFIRSGTGQDQVALVTDYVGSTKVATISTRSATGQWAVTPDTTSAYVMMPNLTWTLEEIAAAVSTGSGSGARTVTITINDGTTVLQNARVRLTNGAETYTGLTNASGVVVFNVDDNDWIVSITKAGYSYSGTTLTVNGTETATYSMTLISLTASDVDKVTGYWTVLDEEGNEASGIVVTVKARQASRGSAGALHDAATRTATSAANGLVQFTNMIPGWRYSVVANDEYVADFTVPADAVTSVELGSIVARLT